MLEELLEKIFNDFDKVFGASNDTPCDKCNTYSYVKSATYKNGKEVKSTEKEVVNGKTTIDKQTQTSIGNHCSCGDNCKCDKTDGCKCNDKDNDSKLQKALHENETMKKKVVDLIDENQELVKVNRELAREIEELKAKLEKIKKLF